MENIGLSTLWFSVGPVCGLATVGRCGELEFMPGLIIVSATRGLDVALVLGFVRVEPDLIRICVAEPIAFRHLCIGLVQRPGEFVLLVGQIVLGRTVQEDDVGAGTLWLTDILP